MSLSKRGGKNTPNPDSFLSRVTNSELVSKSKQVASDTLYVSNKLMRSTGKAMWQAGISFLILIVPLIIEMDREAQLTEMENQQHSLLGTPPLLAPK